MDAKKLDKQVELTKAAKLILAAYDSSEFEKYKSELDRIPDSILKKLFKRSFEQSGMYYGTNFRIVKSYIRYVDGIFSVKLDGYIYNHPFDSLSQMISQEMLKSEDNTDSKVISRLKRIAYVY